MFFLLSQVQISMVQLVGFYKEMDFFRGCFLLWEITSISHISSAFVCVFPIEFYALNCKVFAIVNHYSKLEFFF